MGQDSLGVLAAHGQQLVHREGGGAEDGLEGDGVDALSPQLTQGGQRGPEGGREPPDAEREDVVAPDAGVGDALAVLVGDDEAREDRLLHRGVRRAAARRGRNRRNRVGGEGGVIALGVGAGDGAALSKAGELLLDAVGTDGNIVFSSGGCDSHFALKGDVGICNAFAASTDACAANNDFFLFICTAADRFDGGTAVRIALDGDLIALVITVVFSASTAADGRAVPQTYRGEVTSTEAVPSAYSKELLTDLARNKMGFDGYINSDTGIAHNMAWGVEMLDVPERIGFAVANAGVDIISGLFDNEASMEAYNRGKNGYYETHPLPEGFAKEELTLTDEALNRAVARTLTELFALGMFENPYRDPDEATRIVATPSDWEAAADAHRRSVVLLKNDGTLPLTADKRANKKIYAEAFLKNAKHAADSTAALRKELADTCTLVDDPAQADFALLFVSPSSGEYFNATPGYLELDICEDKTVCNVDANGKPMADTHTETTLHGGKRLAEIAASVHANGGKVITNVNITLAWQLGNVEPLCDVLLAGFDTYRSATLDVIFGCFAPTGKLPLTLPRGDAVLAVNADGVCISPNDVPGYDKDRYMPDSLKDENGKAYAYRDAAGNYYEYGFGLEG